MSMTDEHHRDPEHPHRFEHLREELRDDLEVLEEAAIEAEQATGRREQTRAEAKRGVVRRVARMTGGTLLCLLGLALLVLPGPGLVVLAMGLVLLAVDVPWAARLLERVRERLPEGEDGKVSPYFIGASATVGVVGIGLSLWWTFLR